MRRGLIVLAVLLTACGGAQAVARDDNPPPNPKWFVCKYETDPKGVERLQTGQNPIDVSENAFPAGVTPAVGVEFNDAQGRSLIIAEDVGQPEPPTRDDCPPPNPPPTTTTSSTTTSSSTSTTAPSTTTTTTPTPTLFAIEVAPLCPDGTAPLISITFGNRPDLDGQTGTLTFSTGGSIPLVFDANATVTVPYPASAGGGPVTMTYTLGAESVTRSTTFPEACAPATTTTTSPPGGTTTTTTSGPPATAVTTTVVPPGVTTTTLPPTFTFGAAATVCVAEVPTIRIVFQNTFPALAGHVGTLTMSDVNGNLVSSQPLVYQPGTTVDLLYPGTAVNPDGSVDDVPGWILTDDGFWIRDPSDAFLRDGIRLSYTVNPTATAFVTYPPESSTCANPNGPFPPAAPPVPRPPATPGVPPAPAPLPPTL